MSRHISRRQLLHASGLGFGALALEYLLQQRGAAHDTPSLDMRPRPAHFAAPARAIIMLVQNGGPSHMDLFDPKPELTRRDGQSHADRLETFQRGSEAHRLLGTPFRFHKRGRCGMDMSEVLPHLGSIADDLCMVRSMVSEHNNHTEGLVLLNTGKIFPGRPALGSWVSYGLGTENQNLPAYIVLRDPAGYNTSGTLLWQNGFLPPMFRGTEVSTQGTPVLNLRPSVPVPDAVRRADLDLLARLNDEHRRRHPHEAELETRIRNYELAARMQLAAGDLLDLSREPQAMRRLYGLDNPTTAGYGLRCLMARRLVEAGVRFVQIFPPVQPQFQPWDAHNNVLTENQDICGRTDLPSAGLIKDLKQRGLLDSTIVMWSGEFGRLPITQNSRGRDHNRNAFTTLLAGGGFKGGHVHGATDDLGYASVEKRVTVPDLHATLLRQLGLDHARLTYRHHGSDESLTDARVTRARVVAELLG
ncbi:MAG: DUF1501 domain-containing protein [Planctomycetes bacterium]|nr:DUF1501 domain-containing protein [Planctomycetota bacterium]